MRQINLLKKCIIDTQNIWYKMDLVYLIHLMNPYYGKKILLSFIFHETVFLPLSSQTTSSKKSLQITKKSSSPIKQKASSDTAGWGTKDSGWDDDGWGSVDNEGGSNDSGEHEDSMLYHV